ncbi:nucleoside triphosphate pyrophosphohydrolase family protein [Vibrio mangrovi]|uniref:Nucleoside triphosphate pyrophosphohydrolase family protein n=1 Tax=Vibrio mangrovi TaxID=474394 RepID=A0A1Y6IPH5_9VIBR|nr:nucleoside triphosphate pyrophosphohydrolase family protein [Vibrio mangrovi]MDW6004230.1 nucleoside triphosphate pyrophosphohydrolase family protein [Vibrio mangrovi]SMR98971.1 Phosphoribosyl-ATP pyrophosphohydrolase [Vibrio mangrovi]
MYLSKLTPAVFEHLYNDIVEFRLTFDLPVNQPDSLDSAADTLHTSLAIEELTELAEAQDKTEQADAIVDTVYVLMGRLVHLGHHTPEHNPGISYLIDLLLNVADHRNIDFIPCWDEVHSSNMSKVCRSQKEYDETESFYAEQGIKLAPVIKGDYIIAKCAEDFVSAEKTIRQGKVLKSVYYRPAALSELTQ